MLAQFGCGGEPDVERGGVAAAALPGLLQFPGRRLQAVLLPSHPVGGVLAA